MLALLSQMSVIPVSQLEESNALSTPFVLSNESYLPIYVASLTCRFEDFEWTDGANLKGNKSLHKIGRSLSGQEKMTVPCYESLGIFSQYPLRQGTIMVEVGYRPFIWPFWTRTATRKFTAVTTSTGSVAWLPVI